MERLTQLQLVLVALVGREQTHPQERMVQTLFFQASLQLAVVVGAAVVVRLIPEIMALMVVLAVVVAVHLPQVEQVAQLRHQVKETLAVMAVLMALVAQVAAAVALVQ